MLLASPESTASRTSPSAALFLLTASHAATGIIELWPVEIGEGQPALSGQ